METSSTVTRDPQTQNSKEFPCPHCSETFKKFFNLKRHIECFHVSISEVPVEDLNSGYCSCQTCPFKCHRVADLRKHLSEDHNMIFHIENLTFNTARYDFVHKSFLRGGCCKACQRTCVQCAVLVNESQMGCVKWSCHRFWLGNMIPGGLFGSSLGSWVGWSNPVFWAGCQVGFNLKPRWEWQDPIMNEHSHPGSQVGLVG